jgi:hypothetical protein
MLIVVCRAPGLVVTIAHVVGDARDVRFIYADGIRSDAEALAACRGSAPNCPRPTSRWWRSAAVWGERMT